MLFGWEGGGGGSGVAPSPRRRNSGSGEHEGSSWNQKRSVAGVLPVLRGGGPNSSTSTGANTSSRKDVSRAVDFAAGLTSPVSTWTPEAVEASTSTLLAIFAETDFPSPSTERDIENTSGGGDFGGGLQQHQRYLQHQQHLREFDAVEAAFDNCGGEE